MLRLTLQRGKESDAGTPGVLTYQNGLVYKSWVTGELPYLNNLPMVSCIPPGVYICKWVNTGKHPNGIYMLQGVAHRFDTEIHNGNYFGNVNKINPWTKNPYKSNVDGCVLIGEKIGVLLDQQVVLNSDIALAEFNSLMNKQDFELEILGFEIGVTLSSPRENSMVVTKKLEIGESVKVMNVNTILSTLGKTVATLNMNDWAEDITLLSAAIAGLTVAPFNLATAVTWLALGVLCKAGFSILSNLNVFSSPVLITIGNFISALNNNDTAEDLGLLAGAIGALSRLPFDPNNGIWLLAVGMVIKAGLSLIQQLNKLLTPPTPPVPPAAVVV